MRKIVVLLCAVFTLFALATYAWWTTQRPVAHYLSDLRIEPLLEQGRPGAAGNLLGLQPRMTPADYQDARRLQMKFEAYLRQARTKGLLGPRTIVVLPEHIGTWLWLSGEKDEVYRAEQLSEASGWLTLSNPLAFLGALVEGQGERRLSEAQLRMKAARMADDYQRVFGGLARQFGVTLVAGSIVLPEPGLQAGRLTLGKGPLYNVTVTFGPDGLPMAAPLRQHRVQFHRFLAAGTGPALQVLQTPAGPLAVALGDDARMAQVHAQVKAQGVRMLAVPGFVSSDVDEPAPPEAPALTGAAPAGLVVYLHGRFWSHRGVGQGYSWQAGQRGTPRADPGTAGIINLWL
ncbi:MULTISPECIES: carbon-nitrogen hydrolase family protein [Pseudomonas]|uniref:Carbon-nitrogen hydrolase family protein n=1 Tax=Pseudomonas quercus TaxID=2722792 RepID=A0ABX0YB98_9PSED|nr:MULTISPECIES: carbon-nitrogen hydrolase family protein [Pseudomonas]MBF7140853.1 carbon-nitrogen hydrolase family protein [Pseudomonas sp. LY10J]NJO99387.1 carbon-nitrogen hydrolase family protein [Pseudomonas quercus]